MKPTAKQILQNIINSGIIETEIPSRDEVPANVDRTDTQVPVDVAVPPPRLPRTGQEQGMSPTRAT